MPLPDFNDKGDLPEGLYEATLNEVIARFGVKTFQRKKVAARLKHIHQLVQATGKVERFIIYGSFVTAKPEPHDVDIFLVMRNDFSLADCDDETKRIFDHISAEDEIGASVFWIRPAHILLITVEDFVAAWQTKRDKTRRGIVEVRA